LNFPHWGINKVFFYSILLYNNKILSLLDRCYGSVPDAYRAVALPPLGSTDHLTILLAPVYTPVIRKTKKVTKTIRQWTSESIAILQGYFESTNWSNLLSSSDELNEQVEVVSSYINFCEENIIPFQDCHHLP